MATKRILEKTSKEDEEEAKEGHDDKRPKLNDDEQDDNKKEPSAASEETNKASNETETREKVNGNNNDPVNKESTEERVDETIATARHEWLGQVERRHVRVGDDYQVTSLPIPGESNVEQNGNGKKE